jgi:hypothetical protein
MKKCVIIALALIIYCEAARSQNVGIGTTTAPIARLEVRGAGSASTTNALVLKNSDGDTLLRMRNDGTMGLLFNGPIYGRTVNIGGDGMNFYNLDEKLLGGSIFPRGDSSLVLWSDNAVDKYVILQPIWGRVGIGTYSPDAKLHVNGSVILGDSGTVLNRVLKATVSRNLPTMLANTSTITNFTVEGATVGSTVHISPGLPLVDGLVLAYARVSAHHNVEAKFINVTSQTINQDLTAFFITVID